VEDPRAFAALQLLFLSATTSSKKEAVIEALGEGENNDSLAFIGKVIWNSDDPEIAEIAVEQLENFEHAPVTPKLVAIAQSDLDWRIRVAAVEALGDMESGSSLAALGDILHDAQDPRLRIAAAESLGYTEDDRAVQPLIIAARDDPDDRVRTAAVRALGDLGSKSARDALIKLLDQ
jgi:HEAT repeat protein